VFKAGAENITIRPRDGRPETLYPIYWDEIFLAKYARFVAAFGEHVDSMCGVEIVLIGVGWNGEDMPSANLREGIMREEPFYQGEAKAWTDTGFTPDVWINTVQRIVEMHTAAFTQTMLGLLLCDPGLGCREETIPQYARYAAERKVVLQNCGMMPDSPRDYHEWLLPLMDGYRDQTSIAFEALAPCEAVCRINPAYGEYPGIPSKGYHYPGPLSGLVENTLKWRPSYFTAWHGDLEMATPGCTIHEPGTEKALERLFRGLTAGASGP